ncbi:MAG TPA: CHRD domain-containing protein [candidate division Zixibacteria bacterium]|nr:CHRD domain-containing protein [candidate division Zixibacteria bacterium]
MILALAATVLALVAAAATVAAAAPRNFVTPLNGASEVPARDTQARGVAIFQLSPDGQTMSYKLIASNIENVFMAHIHLQDPGTVPGETNGPIAVWLYESTVPGDQAPLGSGRHDGVLVTGSFTSAAFTGPLAGMTMEALVEAIAQGRAYVNVHTNDGVGDPDTGPGDFPGGEIRGQLP